MFLEVSHFHFETGEPISSLQNLMTDVPLFNYILISYSRSTSMFPRRIPTLSKKCFISEDETTSGETGTKRCLSVFNTLNTHLIKLAIKVLLHFTIIA